MILNKTPDFTQFLTEWSQDLESLRQNRLMNKRDFVSFASDRGVDVWSGDPDNLHKLDCLKSDGRDYDGEPTFHPFRMFPLHQVLKACKLGLVTSASLQRDSFLKLAELAIKSLPTIEQIADAARERNRITDLAILLEPIYWPRISEKITFNGILRESDFEFCHDQYRQRVLELVRSLELNYWRQVHESLRVEAARIDNNSELYLLLRLMTWQKREKMKGSISCALWIRHIAEVIRRAFEEAYPDEKWPEEDEAFGTWHPGGRVTVYGAERPLDDELKSKPYLAWGHGLFTGSAVRWYVEGVTEYSAILHVLPEPSKVGIELVNLRGNIESGRDNAALKLRDWLVEDKALRRFSMISFDFDVAANVKAIKRQVEQNNIVGFITASRPDFEFENFTVQELAEIAALIDESKGYSGDAVRNADWTGVVSGRAFESKYKDLSERKPPGLKGEEWGKALASYMLDHPNRADDGRERPFWREIQAALQGRIAHYDFQKENFGFNPDTFEPIDLRQQATS